MINHPVGIAGAARLIFRGLPAAVAFLLPALLACGGAKPGTSNPGNTPPAADVQHTLSVSITGDGSIMSTPAGIACPGRCSASFADGSAVELVARPGAHMALASWGGACAGAGSCVTSLLADTSVRAAFATVDPPPASCAALVPSLPASKTAALPAFYSDPEYCGFATSDGDGNLYLQTNVITSTAGAHAMREGLFVPLQRGFSSFTHQMAPDGAFLAHAPDGTVLSSSPIRGWMSTGGMQANGGVGVSGDCNVTSSVHVIRIDDTARFTSEVELADQKCLMEAGDEHIDVTVDALDRTLLVVGGENLSASTVPAKHMAARWFDAAGQPLTDWFDAGARGSLFPLIGGGVAVRAASGWVSTIVSGSATVGPAPAGFEPGKTPYKVLGGRGYAMVPDWGVGGGIDIVDPSGARCGTLTTISSTDVYTIGRDGSLVRVGSRIHDGSDCSITYYPQTLR
jgi:hypothetical protein